MAAKFCLFLPLFLWFKKIVVHYTPAEGLKASSLLWAVWSEDEGIDAQPNTHKVLAQVFFKVWANNLREAFQHVFNLSLRLQRGLMMMWKTSCLAPPAKNGRTGVLNDSRPDPLWESVYIPSSSYISPQWGGGRCHPPATLCMVPLGEARNMLIDSWSGFNTVQA